MPVNKETYQLISEELKQKNVSLVAVSKTKPAEEIHTLYELGQRDFGENYVQELAEKRSLLPEDIRWHFIGHLQSNKVKIIAPFVHLIHGVDSFKLLAEINKQAEKNNRVIDCLLQMHIAVEETKFGLNEKELKELLQQLSAQPMKNIRVVGLMGISSLTDDTSKVRSEFNALKLLFDRSKMNDDFKILSMGMSSDYQLAIEEGSTMVRIGSLLFGMR